MIPHYYDEQIKRYMMQFMAIFSGLQVITGKRDDKEPKLIDVPIKYGDIDRVVAWIKSDGTQNKLLRIPLMSTVYTGITLDESLRKGISVERRNAYLPTGQLFPDDITTVHQIQPVPYRLELELAIYTSNTEQQLQVLEQILVFFDPTLQIQTTDNPFDWTKISTVRLENISIDNNYPIGSERRVKMATLNFSLPIYLSIPANLKDDFVKDVFIRIGAVNQIDNTNEEILAELDSQGISYEKIFSLDDIDIDQESS